MMPASTDSLARLPGSFRREPPPHSRLSNSVCHGDGPRGGVTPGLAPER
jgi:hypothetical protein